MSTIHKIENKKVHIKWLLCAKYYTNLQISRTFSFYMYFNQRFDRSLVSYCYLRNTVFTRVLFVNII